MHFFVACDVPKRDARGKETGKKPNEWRVLNSSEELHHQYQQYQQDKTISSKVIIEDQLFYGDICSFECRPIYWEGPIYEMRKGPWYYDMSAKYMPCEELLSNQLETGFNKYAEELNDIKVASDYKKYPLFGPFSHHYVLFASPTVAYLVSENITSKVAQVVVNTIRKQDIWGTKLVREENGLPKGKLAGPNPRNSMKGIPSTDTASKPNHLVLVVHGIGQKLFTRDGMYTFASDVTDLRRRMDVHFQDMAVDDKYMILPVQWREIVDFAVEPETFESHSDMGLNDIQGTEETLPSIDEIIIPTNPYKGLLKDVCLDILLYLTESHRTRMLRTVSEEINRIWHLFQTIHAQFSGNVTIIGHSLGSLIVYDLLSMTDAERESHNIMPIPMAIQSFFMLGSPLSMMALLRGEIITTAASENKRARIINSTYLYNIYHMYDPVAHRLEPLLTRDYPKEPSSISEAEPSTSKQIMSLNPLRHRVDFVVKGGYFESAVQYLSAISKHATYWTNDEVASFLCRELHEIEQNKE